MEKLNRTSKKTAQKKSSITTSGIAENTSNKFEWGPLAQVVGSAAGLVGIAGAILYILGSSFYEGKFDALNVTSLILVGMPIENYLLGGYRSFLVLIIIAIWAIFFHFLMNPITQMLKLKLMQMNKPITEWIRLAMIVTGICGGVILIFWGLTLGGSLMILCELVGTSMAITSWLMFRTEITEFTITRITYLVIACLLLLIIQLKVSYQMGYREGCTTTLAKSTKVTLFSDTQLSPTSQTKIDGSYQFESYYLLFSDRDSYYLYKDVDPKTLKPKVIIVVRKTSIKSSDITVSQLAKSTKDSHRQICITKAAGTTELP